MRFFSFPNHYKRLLFTAWFVNLPPMGLWIHEKTYHVHLYFTYILILFNLQLQYT